MLSDGGKFSTSFIQKLQRHFRFNFQHKSTLDLMMPFYTCRDTSKTTGRPNLSFEYAFSVLNESALKIKEAKWKNL